MHPVTDKLYHDRNLLHTVYTCRLEVNPNHLQYDSVHTNEYTFVLR